jgi:predicted RNA-binding protein with PIN domain
MPGSYIIDGYNLIHALGMIQHKLDPGGLEESRRKLLTLLADAFGAGASSVTVVFDAQHAPPGLPHRQQYHGLHIHFAPKNQSADDLIETMLDETTQPRLLVIVSNDGRLQNAAKQRGARAWSHEDLLDYLEKREKARSSPPSTGGGRLEPADERRRAALSPEELKRWLKEFDTLESDPEFKEFFDHNKFE